MLLFPLILVFYTCHKISGNGAYQGNILDITLRNRMPLANNTIDTLR